MSLRWWALVPALAVAACSDRAPERADGRSLERSAVERGLAPAAGQAVSAGAYARGDDRLCLLAGEPMRIGAAVSVGDGGACGARGTARLSGETLRIDFGEGCRFDAAAANDRIRFPGALPAACARRCSGRASFAGLDVERLSDAASEAAAQRDARGRPLCG